MPNNTNTTVRAASSSKPSPIEISQVTTLVPPGSWNSKGFSVFKHLWSIHKLRNHNPLALEDRLSYCTALYSNTGQSCKQPEVSSAAECTLDPVTTGFFHWNVSAGAVVAKKLTNKMTSFLSTHLLTKLGVALLLHIFVLAYKLYDLCM